MTNRGAEEITDQTIAALQVKWKGRNVREEVLKMHLWLLRRPGSRPSNVWLFIDNWLKKAPATVMPTVVNAWWTTDERTLNQGKAIGMDPRPGELMPDYRERLKRAMQDKAA